MTTSAVIHLIDDDDGVRQSLAFSLTTAGLAVRTYESAVAFLAALPGMQPGCVVSDVRMPGMDGLELQRRLNERTVNLPVIIMTGHGDVRLAVEAMKAGAIDFIEKPFDDDVLLVAIRNAIESYNKIEERELEATDIRTHLDSLSLREKQVLQGLIAGQPNKVIAYNLGLSARTVEVHRAKVMTKMGAGSLSDIVRMALIADLLPTSC